MTLFTRTRDLAAAGFVDLLDKAEDPAKMIRLIVLEMEETLVEVSASAARAIAERREMHRQIARLDALQESWAGKADFALSKDRDDLAKGALIEKQKVAELGEQLRAEIDRIEEGLRTSEDEVTRLHAKLAEARTRQHAIAARARSARGRGRRFETVATGGVDDAVTRFDRLERRADALAPQAVPTLDDEIAALRHAETVEAELAAMKALRAPARS